MCSSLTRLDSGHHPLPPRTRFHSPQMSRRLQLTSSEVQPGDVDLNQLTVAQKNAADGMYSLSMRSFIEWLKSKFVDSDTDGFVKNLEEEFMEIRDKLSSALGKTAYPRVIEAFAHLYLGWSSFLNFSLAQSVLSDDECNLLSAELIDIFGQMIRRYMEYTFDANPSEMFIKKIDEMIHSNEVYVHDVANHDPPIAQKHIGYCDEQCYYFYTEMAYEAVVKLCKDQGIQFPLSQKALVRQLAEKGLILTSGNEKTPRHVFYGKRNRFLMP